MAILLTRPAGKNHKMAVFFRKNGQKTYACPLLKLCPWPQTSQDILLQKAAKNIILTSQNALAALLPENKAARFFVVGHQSAAYLVERGFKKIAAVAATSEELSDQLDKNTVAGQAFLYLSGDRISFDFSQRLQGLGGRYDRAIVYQSVATSRYFSTIHALITNKTIRYVTLFSEHTAERFLAFLQAYEVHDQLASLGCLALSEKIEKKIHALPWQKTFVSPEPNLKRFCSFALEVILKDISHKPI